MTLNSLLMDEPDQQENSFSRAEEEEEDEEEQNPAATEKLAVRAPPIWLPNVKFNLNHAANELV